MLIIRNDNFIIRDDEIYIVGSASNHLYINNIFQMGQIEILGWYLDPLSTDISKAEKLLPHDKMKLYLYDYNVPFREKCRIIKKHVAEADAISLKLSIKDAVIACHYANRYKKKYVIESGSDAFSSVWYHGGGIKYKIAAVPFELLIQYYHRKAKYIIYVSKAFLQKKYKSKAYQIGCPDVVLEEVSESVLEKRIKRIGVNTTKYTLGLIGATNVEYRGHDTLIKVAGTLSREGYNIDIRFLGSDKGRSQRLVTAREEGIEDKIYFDGYKNKEGVYEWIDQVDILVMPTLTETLGRAVIEAMARGCPVVGSIETALAEQIPFDCLAKARDINGICEILRHMFHSGSYMKSCIYENFYRAQKYLSAETNLKRKNFYDMFYKKEIEGT
ncbi:MAG: glycosyltransferase [Hungatella sp.]|nr:glycosyltransferase [Hungatella sp.]